MISDEVPAHDCRGIRTEATPSITLSTRSPETAAGAESKSGYVDFSLLTLLQNNDLSLLLPLLPTAANS